MNLSITLLIILITVGVSLYANSNQALYAKLVFNPYQVIQRKEWHRIFTHALIHDRQNIFHLFFNMYVLYSFGNLIETLLFNELGILGELYYLFIYVAGVFVATIPALLKHKNNVGYNSVGASGAVSAVLFSTIAFIPLQGGIGIMFIPFSLPPIVFGLLYIAYEMYMQKRGGTTIAHDAHIWGAAFGFLFTLIFVPGVFMNFVEQLVNAF